MGKLLLKALALLALTPLVGAILKFAIVTGWDTVLHLPFDGQDLESHALLFGVQMTILFSALAVLIVAILRLVRIPYWLVFPVTAILVAAGTGSLMMAAVKAVHTTGEGIPVPDVSFTVIMLPVVAGFPLSACLCHWLIYRRWSAAPRAKAPSTTA